MMGSLATDDLHIIRTPCKVILSEIVKKLGGSETQYECWFEDGKYHSVASTIIASIEANTSGKVEQVMGYLADTIEAAEEAAAGALIGMLKSSYRLQTDDVNLMEQARSKEQKKNLESYLHAVMYVHEKQAEIIQQLTKGWDQLLADMQAVQEICEYVCGTTLAIPSTYFAGSAKREIAKMLWQLSEWSEQKIYESTVNLKEIIEQSK